MSVGFQAILLMFFFLYLYLEFLFITKAHDSEDEMYPAYRHTKSYLNLAHIRLICSDTLLRNLEFFGKTQKKNAFWKMVGNQPMDSF